jgi:hypothetical protein
MPVGLLSIAVLGCVGFLGFVFWVGRRGDVVYVWWIR